MARGRGLAAVAEFFVGFILIAFIVRALFALLIGAWGMVLLAWGWLQGLERVSWVPFRKADFDDLATVGAIAVTLLLNLALLRWRWNSWGRRRVSQEGRWLIPRGPGWPKEER